MTTHPGPTDLHTTFDALCFQNFARPDSVAWVEDDDNIWRSWTWRELLEQTRLAIGWLHDLGVEKGDRVANTDANSVSWAILDFACAATGIIHVPIDPRLPQSQVDQCIDTTNPKLIFRDSADIDSHDSEYRLSDLSELSGPSSRMKYERYQVTPNDTACILFTSGTSGKSRGVMLSHQNLITNAFAKLDAMPENTSDRRLNFLPFAHAYARTCELTTWVLSGCQMNTVHGIQGVLLSAPKFKPTLINGVPSFYERLHELWQSMGQDKNALMELLGPKIRRVASGGAPVTPKIRNVFAQAGLPIFQGYGLTEASPVVCSNRNATDGGDHQLEGVGPVVNGVDIKIDADGKLWVRGPGVMQGYWNDPETTDTRLRDGWLDTGDIAEYVESSNSHSKRSVRILGRADDTIVLSNGYKVSPAAIEQVAALEPPIVQCVLVGEGQPHTTLIVYAKDNFDDSELLGRIQQRLSEFPKYAHPRSIKVAKQAFTAENQLAHWKGNPDRKKIGARFC